MSPHPDAPGDGPDDDEGTELPIAMADHGDPGEGGKLKMIVQLVKKCLGVKDIAAMRLSLPASLLEPIPNLEYWHYLDRPDLFAAINDSADPFERMLAVLRFTFTKDLKFVHGKVCKPYNSVLGEHFRAHWDVLPVTYPDDPCPTPVPQSHTVHSTTSVHDAHSMSETASVRSARSSKSNRSGTSSTSKMSKRSKPVVTNASTSDNSVPARMPKPSIGCDPSVDEEQGRVRVVFVTEQVSHHPPVSAYHAACPSRHLELSGIDQISAKVSGTTVRVSPGQYNQGIYVDITGGHGQGEQYNITHPTASVNGILRGSFYITFWDSTIITCTGGKGSHKLRTIVEYKEESWLGRAHFLVEGVIHTVLEGDEQQEEWVKVKHVPVHRVVAVFDGTWRGVIRWRRVGAGSYPTVTASSASSPNPSHVQLPKASWASASASKADLSTSFSHEYTTLLDVSALRVVPKEVRALKKQLPNESRKLWEPVTDRLIRKEFGEATKEKVSIEQRQREAAAERKKRGVEFEPRYFEKGLENGRPTLTSEGRQAVVEEIEENT